jgi:hypothetical protein
MALQPSPSRPSPSSPQADAAAPHPPAPIPLTERQLAPPKHSNLAVLVHYHAGSEPAQMEADRLAARLGTAASHADIRPEANVPQQAVIRYFAAEDHAAAHDLGHELGDMGYSWHLENFAQRDPKSPGTLEVWLPERGPPSSR